MLCNDIAVDIWGEKNVLLQTASVWSRTQIDACGHKLSAYPNNGMIILNKVIGLLCFIKKFTERWAMVGWRIKKCPTSY